MSGARSSGWPTPTSPPAPSRASGTSTSCPARRTPSIGTPRRRRSCTCWRADPHRAVRDPRGRHGRPFHRRDLRRPDAERGLQVRRLRRADAPVTAKASRAALTRPRIMPATYDYDLVVIGSGPAGEKGAAQAAYFGKRVALVERARHLGGAGINTGTLPSKTLRETALYFSGLHQRGLYGIDYTLRENLTVGLLMHREQAVVENERRIVQRNLDRHRIEAVRGEARLADAHTVRVLLPDRGREGPHGRHRPDRHRLVAPPSGGHTLRPEGHP